MVVLEVWKPAAVRVRARYALSRASRLVSVLPSFSIVRRRVGVLRPCYGLLYMRAGGGGFDHFRMRLRVYCLT